MDEITAIGLAVTAVPIIVAGVSMFIGAKQVREFHRRTGDDSVLAHITSFSKLREGPHENACAAPKAGTRVDA
jgi:hypothetical protein